MIFIVVKFKPKPEYVEKLPRPGCRVHHRYPQRAGQPVVRLVAQPGGSIGIRSGGRLPRRGCRQGACHQRRTSRSSSPNAALLASTPLIISQTIDATGWSEMGEMKV